jgi:hypothetical protein
MSTQNFTPDELELIAEALDSHLYWQLSDEQRRNSGFVLEPYTKEERECIELEERVRKMITTPPLSMSYDRACRRAATNQGLDPLTVAATAREGELTSAGISYVVEQTGGFTMVACFRHADEVVTITNEGAWMVIAQSWDNWINCGEEYEDLSSRELQDPDDIIDAVIARASTS